MTQNPSHEITCVDCQTQIEEYMAGELDTATESAIASHLTTCERCQHEFNLAEAIDTVLEDLPKPTSPPDILQEVTAYVRTHPNSGWMHRFFDISMPWDVLRSPILRVSVLVCLIGVVLFGIHQHQQHVEIAQAKSDFNYAMRKMQYAFHKTGLAVNDSFSSLKVDEAPRRALKPTVKISSAINRSLGILNHLTGDAPNLEEHQNSDKVKPKNENSGSLPTETTSSIQGETTQ